jgi:uncharacterized protein (DUF302 family)
MFATMLKSLPASALALALAAASPHPVLAGGGTAAIAADGIVKVKSAYPMAETVERLKADIAEKGIKFFETIDQAALARGAGIDLRPSMLLVFGNPPLGTQFITARAEAGLDWPVRLLVFEDAIGEVWTAYTDFGWIARRHGITNRDAQFAMASEVIASITGAVAAK